MTRLLSLKSIKLKSSTQYRHRSNIRSLSSFLTSPQTFIEKIVQNFTYDLPPNKFVKSGDFIILKPQHVMTHDNTAPVISKFKSIGASKISNPRQPVFTIDHDVQNKSPANLKKYSNIQSFAHQQDVDFFPPGRGIGHQIMIEEGYAFPGSLMVASDSHSNMYGGVGCVGTPVVRTDAAAIWATQRTWWQIPEIVKVELKGPLPSGVSGKDIIVALCGSFNQDQVLNAAIEFVGEGVSHLSIDERLAISNMTTEWGALAGVFPIDQILIDWYKDLLRKRESDTFIKSHSIPSPLSTHPRLSLDRVEGLSDLAKDLKPDPDAYYSKTLTLDLSTLVPHVSGPNSVKLSTPLPELESQNIKIHKAYLLSCVNSRMPDLEAAARVMKGKKVAPGVQFYIAAASSFVQAEAEAKGVWATLIDAGAQVLPAGCGPCIGLGVGLLEKGEVGISATNRNYKGRMGSPLAQAYLASPAVVAASALAGKICGPTALEQHSQSISLKPEIAIEHHLKKSTPSTQSPSNQIQSASDLAEPLLPSFPKTISGPLIFAPADNINTDGIYPGKYTYQDDITPDQQAQVVMENYDPKFARIVKGLVSKPTTQTNSSSVNNDLAKPQDVNLTKVAIQTRSSGKGVILISGLNFGTGSSREQAATALKNSGISLVIAGSFSEIFKRNAINNGLICLESTEFLKFCHQHFLAHDSQQKNDKNQSEDLNPLTVQTGWNVNFQSQSGLLSVSNNSRDHEDHIFQLSPIGRSVQEIFVDGGLEGWVRNRI